MNVSYRRDCSCPKIHIKACFQLLRTFMNEIKTLKNALNTPTCKPLREIQNLHKFKYHLSYVLGKGIF